MTNEDVEKILRNQLAMNPKTWAALVARGVTTETPLSLDFAYIAPGEPQAVALRAFLTTQTDYVIDVQSAKKGALSRRSWEVVGRTNPQPLSLAVLDEWVGWMVAAGFANGRCEFDGWGTQLRA